LVTQAVDKETFRNAQRPRPYADRESEDDYAVSRRSELRDFIVARGAADETRIADLDLGHWPGRAVSKYIFTIAAHQPHDSLSETVMRRSIAMFPKIWESHRQRHEFRRGSVAGEDRYDAHFEHDLVEAACRYLVQISSEQAVEMLAPALEAAAIFPDKAADVVNWLVLAQGDGASAPTFWALWQRFADDFVANVQPSRVDEEHSEEAKLLHELFLGTNWAEQRDWLPLHGETERLRAFFRRLPSMTRAFEFYSYYLAKEGTPTLPDALAEVSEKLQESANDATLNDVAVYYLEEILTRLIYGGNPRIRSEASLRQATLIILDALVAAGSSRGYKLRDDFLTPPH
jgi:hypothetical protein